jgi:hypothetical protein
MKPLKQVNKDDASHGHTAMPTRGVFVKNMTSKIKIMRPAKESEASFPVKFKYALHTQLFICFNMQINRLKKTP